jgi:hypothetical protein
MNDKSKPTHAHDHMTVAHVKQTIETRPQPESAMKHLTTAHLAEALPQAAGQQPSNTPASQTSTSVPASQPPPKKQK